MTNTEYKGQKISEMTKFDGRKFVNYDFANSDLTSVIFKNTDFENCVFNKTILNNTRFWCCFFDRCKFINTNITATLGAWGGGLSNCIFEKCKFGGIIYGSYFIDCDFNKCKIKTTFFQTFLMKNVRFAGLLDDLSFQKFTKKDIYEYQSAETAQQVEERIRKIVGNAFDREKVILENIDFAEARLQFADFENCEINGIIPPDDDKHILIYDIATVAQRVRADIEQNWSDMETKTWALRCVEKYAKRMTEIVSFYEFKHFADEAFADKLLSLFKKYNEQ
jgi:uncharacterized protein YjbI with pentapeptide repeats